MRKRLIKQPIEVSAIADSIQAFDGFARENHLPESMTRKVKIALDDLLKNTVSYGYPDNKRSSIDIELRATAEYLQVVICDDGIPFDPLMRAEPKTDEPLESRKLGGLGIHLVRNLTDDIDYQRQEGRNILTLTFRLPTAPNKSEE